MFNLFLKFSSNVYDKVEIRVEENFLNQLTFKELEFARYLDYSSSKVDPVEEIIKKDFFVRSNLLSERYALNINNALPTSNFIILNNDLKLFRCY